MEQIRITEALAPQQTPDTVEEIRPPKPKGSFRRSPQGQLVMRAGALWIVERLNASGMTSDKWFAADCNLGVGADPVKVRESANACYTALGSDTEAIYPGRSKGEEAA